MARPLRLEVAGGVHHVVARGIERRDVFLDDRDRAAFIGILRDVVDRFGWEVLAFCLMPNHYHLVVRTPTPNLARGMRQLNGVYAQRFNRRYGRVGPLWQGRYLARLVQHDAYLATVLRYVVRNPVRAGLCETPRGWRWSSHQAALGLCAPGVVAVQQLLDLLGPTRLAGRRAYRSATEADGPDPELVDDVFIGDDHFAAAALSGIETSREVPRRQRMSGRPPLADLLAAGDPHGVRTAYVVYGYNQREIAEELGCHYSTVSRRLRDAEAA